MQGLLRLTAIYCAITCSALLCVTHAQAEPKSDGTRLITYNVWYGFTKLPERKQQWIDWMVEQQPDLVCLQELNGYTASQLKRDALKWGHSHSELLKEDGFPTGVTSRRPIQDVQKLREGFHHGTMRVHTDGSYLYVIHLHPSNWQTRRAEIQLVLDDVRRLPADAKIMLVGDFNTFSPADRTHYSAQTTLESFFADRDQRYRESNLREGRLDYSVLEQVEAAGFVDLELRFRDTFQGTFPAAIEKPGDDGDSRRLDYVFANPAQARLCLGARSVVDSSTAELSDHYPLIVDFRAAP